MLMTHVKLCSHSAEVCTILTTWHSLHESFSGLSKDINSFRLRLYILILQQSVHSCRKPKHVIITVWQVFEILRPDTPWFTICMLFHWHSARVDGKFKCMKVNWISCSPQPYEIRNYCPLHRWANPGSEKSKTWPLWYCQKVKKLKNKPKHTR